MVALARFKQAIVVRSSDKSVDDELLNDWTRPDSGK